MRALRIGLWAVAISAVFAAIGLFANEWFNRNTEGSVVADIRLGAPFRLVDHNGDPIDETAMAGHPSAVFFGFTHCPEVCPTTLHEMTLWFEELGEESGDIAAYFITVDPERDTPDVLKEYVTNFSDRIVGITGDPKEAAKLARAWRVYWKKVPLDDGDYTMDHTASVFLVDGEGRFKGTIAFGESSETAVKKLRRLAKTS